MRGADSLRAEPGMTLFATDVLKTGAKASMGVTFVDNSRFALGPSTEIALDTFRFDTTTHQGEFISSVKKGRLSVISGRLAKASPEAMKVRTPSQILGVRGTEFLVLVN